MKELLIRWIWIIGLVFWIGATIFNIGGFENKVYLGLALLMFLVFDREKIKGGKK